MLLFLVLVASAFSALFILKRAFQPKEPWPPGPPAWPLIGHLHLLGTLPHQSLCHLSKLYGPLMGLHLGPVPTLVVSSPAMAKEILQTHDLAFASRPRTAAGVHLAFNCTNMGMAPYGPYWKRLRQLFSSELLSSKRLESSRHVREEEIQALMRSVLQSMHEKSHTPIDIHGSTLMISNNINSRMAVGKRMTEISSAMNGKGDLLSLVKEVMYLLSVFNVGDFIPWMAWLDVQGYGKRMKEAGHRLQVVMQAIIDERRECYKAAKADNEISPNDMLDVMLRAGAQEDGNIAINDDNIKGVLMDVLTGGSDTSSVITEWTLAELINHPEVMQKVQEELDEVVGKARVVGEGDIPALPYLRAVVKESMRLHPPGPLLLPHEALEECQIEGYKIPAKTRAYVNVWAIGRNAMIWERPLEFWPERFQTSNLDVHGKNFELLPFGSGRRRCPALALGLLNVHLMLAALVQGFTWSRLPPAIPEDTSLVHLDMSERFGLTVTMAKPLSPFATPRLPLHIYYKP